MNTEDKLAQKYLTKEGYKIEIIEYFGHKNCTIKFSEGGHILKNRTLQNIKNGRIKNPYHRSIAGVGYIGEGLFHTQINNKVNLYYKAWKSMLERSYSKKSHLKRPTYKDVTVCAEWHNFQVFAAWFEDNYNPETMQGWHLDKDILIKGNKIYSSETCCFVPGEVNRCFVCKEINFVQRQILAEKWKGVVDTRIYEILNNNS